MRFDIAFERLSSVRWGAASQWSDAAREWVLAYYRGQQAFWPPERACLEPCDWTLQRASIDPLGGSELARVDTATAEIVGDIRTSGAWLESTTEQLIR